MTEEQHTKKKQSYGYFASLPMIVAIIHYLGAILFQSTIQANENVYSNLFSLSMMFSSSTFVSELCSLNSLSMAKTVTSIYTILFGIVFVFLSTRAVKGKFKSITVSLILYGFDTLMIVPASILSLLNTTPLHYDVATFIVALLIHLIFLALLVYTFYLASELKKSEAQVSEG